MFGPGLEQLQFSLLTKMIQSPDVLPIAGIPQRQIDGASYYLYFRNAGKFKLSALDLM